MAKNRDFAAILEDVKKQIAKVPGVMGVDGYVVLKVDIMARSRKVRDAIYARELEILEDPKLDGLAIDFSVSHIGGDK